MRFIYFLFAVSIVLVTTQHCAAKEWRGIVPLKSTRADVERLLGPSTGPLPSYYLPDSTVDFKYSECRCGEKCKENGWNVPPDTVIVIRVGTKGVVRLAELNIDLTNFKKSPGAEDVPGSFIYINNEEGFAIEGGGDYVSALIYGPRAKDDYLRCPRNSSPPQTKAQEWRGIVPLKSAKVDVERLLGPSVGDPPRYYLPENTVYFQYSNCRCGEKCKDDSWNVPPDTVIVIRVGMKGVVKLADLDMDLTNFKKRPGDEDVPGHLYYENNEEGLIVDTGGGYVSALIYGPRTKDDYLRCSHDSSKRRKYKSKPTSGIKRCDSRLKKERSNGLAAEYRRPLWF